MVDQTSKELLLLYRAGDSQAANEIFDRYVQRLMNLARRRISPKLARRVDPDDVVQSAYRSFFVHAQDGQFVLERAGDLWRLLAGITLKKLHGQVERHSAMRRSINKEEVSTNSVSLFSPTLEPTPLEVVSIREQLARVMLGLSKTERLALELRLKGNTIEEIANAIDRSQRTARRLLEAIRNAMERQLLDEDGV